MKTLDRRSFLATLSCSLALPATTRLIPNQPVTVSRAVDERACWLDVCAPFIVEDAARGLHSEIILTADTPVWSALKDDKLATHLPAQVERNVIRLPAGQSAALDFQKLSLAADFAGGLCVAVAPDTTHTLIKVEVRALEWETFAFTHFRPGLRSARSYQRSAQRGGLLTDYIVSGARLVKAQYDELIAVINIDDQGEEGRPTLELFGARGLLARLPLGALPPFACRHFLLSDLLAGVAPHEALTLRLVDERATLLMSAVHLDYERRDLALDHGSDRFSTFLDYGCATTGRNS